jgi:hypothetical protein
MSCAFGSRNHPFASSAAKSCPGSLVRKFDGKGCVSSAARAAANATASTILLT